MIEALLTVPVTIVRPSADVEDEYTDSASSTSTDTTGAVDQDSTSDQDGRGEVARSQWTLFLRPDELIDADCSVLIGGTRYSVIGDPWPVDDKLTGQAHHLEVKLERSGSAPSS